MTVVFSGTLSCPLWLPGFHPRSRSVGFVVDKFSLELAFSKYFIFLCLFSFRHLFYIRYLCFSWTLCKLDIDDVVNNKLITKHVRWWYISSTGTLLKSERIIQYKKYINTIVVLVESGLCVKSSQVILRLTVSRPASLGASHPSRTRDQFFSFFFFNYF
jgi:hypothetical protein